MTKRVSPAEQEHLKKFGEHLRKIREKKGVTQLELAYDCKTSLSQITRIEKGEINTSLIFLIRVSEKLEISISELMSFKD